MCVAMPIDRTGDINAGDKTAQACVGYNVISYAIKMDARRGFYSGGVRGKNNKSGALKMVNTSVHTDRDSYTGPASVCSY